MSNLPRPKYAAIIDHDNVTDEVRDIALKYDPLNRSGREGFHVTDEGRLRIDDANVIEEHKIIANKIPNDAIRIVRLPAERGQLVHQHGPNGFRLYELPAPKQGSLVGLLGPNGIGKTTALSILANQRTPNLGNLEDPPTWETIVETFRGTATQNHLTKLQHGTLTTAYKPQRVDQIPNHHSGTVESLLERRDDRALQGAVTDTFDLTHLTQRRLDALSGGELQRAALAATLVQDADTYLIDEPSSYLDVHQRLTTARALRTLTEDARVVLVDHDLITLDIAADNIHICYGDPGNYGIISRPLTAREGINRYLEGRLPQENLRIREDAIDLTHRSRRSPPSDTALAHPRMKKRLESFSLTIEQGTINEGEVLGILGQNGLGKTTFAKLLTGLLDPDQGTPDTEATISYKPQLLDATYPGTVESLLARAVDTQDNAFRNELQGPLGLEPIWQEPVTTLSGGQRQRVAIALTLARPADAYLLDEPSAFLDVEQRMTLADTLQRFVERRRTPCLVIDHDLLLLDGVADRAMVFEGNPGVEGTGLTPQPWREGVNRFLEDVGITFRRDPQTHRPRANDEGSRKDREQRAQGSYFGD